LGLTEGFSLVSGFFYDLLVEGAVAFISTGTDLSGCAGMVHNELVSVALVGFIHLYF
jgi:hypothetical protein